MTIKICEYCGEEFYTRLLSGKTFDKQRYCSYKCRGAAYSGVNHWSYGKPVSEEMRKHLLSIAGNTKGTHKSEDVKKRIGDSQRGDKYPTYKGGEKVTSRIRRAVRRNFKFIPLNSCDVDGWEGHHLDFEHVIYIPSELHKSIPHSVSKNRHMDEINDVVYNWFINYYL